MKPHPSSIAFRLAMVTLLCVLLYYQIRWRTIGGVVVHSIEDAHANSDGATVLDVLTCNTNEQNGLTWVVKPLHFDFLYGVYDATAVAVVEDRKSEMPDNETANEAFKFYWNRCGVTALTPKTAEKFPLLRPLQGNGLDPYGLSDYAF